MTCFQIPMKPNCFLFQINIFQITALAILGVVSAASEIDVNIRSLSLAEIFSQCFYLIGQRRLSSECVCGDSNYVIELRNHVYKTIYINRKINDSNKIFNLIKRKRSICRSLLLRNFILSVVVAQLAF